MLNELGLLASDMVIIKSVLHQYSEIETAILFGSRAKGNYKNGSDVDIALKGKNLTDGIINKIHFELNNETLLPYKFDVLNYQTITNKELQEHIDRVGKILFQAL
ncbi:MAG: hypothetical protein RL708_364 [Bacteroidota bacterium]|jgi:predicted nucleotidyltransferase